MKLVNDLTYNELMSLQNKVVRFTSDCILFDNFDVTCRIISIHNRQNVEYVFICINTKTNKTIKIGSNMLNLRFEVIN